MKFPFSILAFLLFFFPAKSQLIHVDDNVLSRKYSFVSTVFNRIFNSNELDSFYQKLYDLKKTGKGNVNIVHIGDSHIQADYLSGIVRNNLQQFFGNAGRGLVFPYQLAQSNAPPDITSSSNSYWQFNRVAHPEISISPGISGYCIKTNAPGASIDLSLKSIEGGSQSFNRLKFFLDSNSSSSWILQTEANNAPFLIKNEEGDSAIFKEVVLDQNCSRFSLSSIPSSATKEFYGVSLENSNPGILYHTIGVNGVRYDQYNLASLFWKQLGALNADLYIISLGTNEAQKTDFNDAAFQQQVSLFLQKIKKVSPNAAVLITTAADSYYKRRRSNVVLRNINISLYNYCTKQAIPIWDLYRITNGYGSAYRWLKQGLMNNDRIHFTSEGYRLQGTLLFNALAKGYNNYVSSY
ncbi:MAG: GDSL-type esterase/lipase family protein [Chitinophagaceae bacterium]